MTKKGNIPNEKKRRKIMKAKKLLAVLMTAAVLTGTAVGSVTTFAATPATITVTNLDDTNAKVKYIQIVEPDTTSVIGWKFCSDDIAREFMEAFNKNTADEALQSLIDLANQEATDNVNGITGTINTSADLGTALAALRGLATTEAEGTTINDIDKAGLYLINVVTSDPSYTYLPMLSYIADKGYGDLVSTSVSVKGSHNIPDKNVDDETINGSVSAGDIVGYSATVEYPYFSPEELNKEFKVTDTLTNATYQAESLQVLLKGTPMDADAYSVGEYADQNTFTINFNYDSKYAGQTVMIKYNVEVGTGEGNVVNDFNSNLTEEKDSVELGKVKVKVLKTDKNNAPLTNATFKIYEASEKAAEGFVEFENVSVYEEKDVQTLYLKEVDQARVTAGADGSLIFIGLDADKTYYVKETIAPVGYTVNPNYYPVGTTTKDDKNSSDDKYIYLDFGDITVDDTNLSSLPSTGGIGTTIFTIGGCVIMIAAAGLFFASRRKEEK